MLIFDNFLLSRSNLLKCLFFERIILQKTFEISYFTTVYYDYWISWLIFFVDWNLRDLLNNLHTINNLTKNYMFSI